MTLTSSWLNSLITPLRPDCWVILTTGPVVFSIERSRGGFFLWMQKSGWPTLLRRVRTREDARDVVRVLRGTK